MKKAFIYIFLGLMTIHISCDDHPKMHKGTKNKDGLSNREGHIVFNVEPVETPATILNDFMSFWYYWNDYIKLSETYISFDDIGKVISRKVFLEALMTGNYLPLKLRVNAPFSQYQLYKIDSGKYEDISGTISQYAGYFYRYYQMEGTMLPDFNFIDINGKLYNKKTCKDKYLVLNCWFIGCHQCVKEIPELNLLVDSCKSRDDIVFISLAFDRKMELKKFLATTPFHYAVIPDKTAYLTDTLKTILYPTQIIIDKTGKIIKVMNDFSDLKEALNDLLKK